MKFWFNTYNEFARVRLFGGLASLGTKIKIIVN